MTLIKVNGIIMAIEDRNGNLHGEKDGKFVPKNKSEEKPYDSRDNFGELNKKLSKALSMTNQEWALWYKAIAENKKLGYWANELLNGDALLKVETENTTKLIITGGTFEKPIAKAIYSFKNSDDMNDVIERLKLWGKIKK